MTDLLPVIFARGQDESIDARLAPASVHTIAQNVRWRKDGRPAKRYGVAAFPTSGLETFAFNTQPVNALTSWNGTPVIAAGSSVRQYSSAAGAWNKLPGFDISEISHFGPGEREIIARDETGAMNAVSSGVSQGMVLHAWAINSVLICWCVKGVDGSMIVTPRTLAAGNSPRVISANNFIYLLSQNGTTLNMWVFDPSSGLTSLASPGTLDASGSHFDAIGRGNDFLIAYQSAATVITVKLFSAIATPALIGLQAPAMVGSSSSFVGITSATGASIFVAGCSPSGVISFSAFNTALTATTGGGTIETDANNSGQPGLVLDSSTTAQVVWGGFVAATESSYMRACQVQATGSGPSGTIGTFFGVSPASKPFMGPAYSTLGSVDGAYIWVATNNANNGSTKWATQRAYYLVKYQANNASSLRRQMHVPNVIPGEVPQLHLSDVLSLGVGYGYLTPLTNAVRFISGSNSLTGFDTVSARSIFESVSTAARDHSLVGRVLQFSGGSLFEFGGAAEETGFSNFPVIQSVTGGSGGALTTASTYIYRAVYEWLDSQGRRHRSAPSDPYTFASGASTSATLVMKPLIADAHFKNASGSAAAPGVTLHVYRTLAGGSTFHRVTPNQLAPSGASAGTATISFIDLMSDATASGQEFIYTDGGVADNTLCPPHTFHTVCNGRLWVGGQLDRCVLTASKILVDGEPTQFSDLDAFSAFLPQKCTGLESIDGTVVAFSEEKIYLITGDGPNDQGIGSFNPPVELPTDVGCVNWRSVVGTSIGIFFQGRRGIFLLPRGFNTPLFVGLPVEISLTSNPYIYGAELVTLASGNNATLGETTVRFLVGSVDPAGGAGAACTEALVYDLRTGGWSVDACDTLAQAIGQWSGTVVIARSIAGVLALHAESPSASYADYTAAYIPSGLATGDIRPFGVAGYGGFDSVVLVGEYRSSCIVQITVSVDGASGDTFTFALTSADAPDGSVYLDVTPSIRLGSAIRVSCSDGANPSAGTEGFIMQALFIEHETIGKTKRLAQARRA